MKAPIMEPNMFDPEVEAKAVEDILEALTSDEVQQLPDKNMPLRHYRAEKGHLKEAIRKLKDTLSWRKEFQVDKIVHCMDENGDPEMRAIIEKENETGKIYCRGYDQEGRVAMYMRPHHENTHDALNNMRHLVYNLERAIACTNKKSGGLEKINLLIDYEHFRVRDSPPLSTSKWTLQILQNHYPERLFKAYVLNPGFFFRTFMTIIRPFMDPVTKAKILLANSHHDKQTKLGERFDLSVLEECAGGEPGAVKDFDSKVFLSIPFDEAYA